MKTPITPLVLLAAFAASPLLTSRLKPLEYAGGYSADEAVVQRRNSNAFAILLGDIRANMSDLMFIKTEQYLHDGILYTPHLDMDAMSQSGVIETKGSTPKANDTEGTPSQIASAVAEHDHDHDHDGVPDHAAEDHHDDHDHDHDGTPDHAAEDHDHEHEGAGTLETIIPTAEHDYRGFIGSLQRQVKPWKDPKEGDTHSGGDELLPWYRVMTISSPNNVRAYLIGGWWLKGKREKKYVNEARKFVEEGIANNPMSFQLHLMRGYILMQDGQLAEARKAFTDGAELAAKLRPADGKAGGWTEYQEEDARASMRMAVFLERRDGDPQKALKLAEKYNAAVGGDGRLEAVIAGIKAGEVLPPAQTVGPPAPGK